MRLSQTTFVTILFITWITVSRFTCTNSSLLSIHQSLLSQLDQSCTILISTENENHLPGLTIYNSSFHSQRVLFISQSTTPMVDVMSGTADIQSCSVYLRNWWSRVIPVSDEVSVDVNTALIAHSFAYRSFRDRAREKQPCELCSLGRYEKKNRI